MKYEKNKNAQDNTIIAFIIQSLWITLNKSMNTHGKMKIILAGGTGYLGTMLHRFFLSQGHEVSILTRQNNIKNSVTWDAKSLGSWVETLNGSDAVINLTGQNIKCLFTKNNLKILKESRIHATRAIGKAIQLVSSPPKVWIQMSSVTVYTHALHTAHTEQAGQIGEPPSRPITWQKMSTLVQEWENAVNAFPSNQTRKVIARISIVMDRTKGSAFDIFHKLAKWGLGGKIAGGNMYVSWIHAQDFLQSVDFLLKNNIKGTVNLTAPQPLPQKKFMAILRKAVQVPIGLPAAGWMLYPASWITKVDPELILKSRYVLPQVLLDHHFKFAYPSWQVAVTDLLAHRH